MGIADETLDAEPLDDDAAETDAPKVKLCKACGERPAGFGQLGHYCKECRDSGAAKATAKGEREAAATPPPAAPRKAAPSRRSKAGKLHEELRNAHVTATTLALMVTNMQALGNQVVADAIEARAHNWASSAVAVAEENPRVAEVLDRLLHGGVWVAFVFNTASSLAFIGTVSGRVQPPLGVIRLLTPELVPLIVQAPDQQPAGVA